MKTKKLRVGVVGCGMISDIYLTNMINQFKNLEVVACCAAHVQNAQRKAAQYHITPCTYEEILANATIDMVVILTPAPTHFDLVKRALLAGKHVYVEKTMTINLEQAKELVQLAETQGLYLGVAPDTFLGAALQKARQVIDSGIIGEVTSFNVCSNRDLDRLTCIYKFLCLPGGGICYDYGVYYLTALVSLLGPIASVSAVAENKKPVRVNIIKDDPDYGKSFAYENEAQVSALLQTKSGVTGTFTLNGESISKDLAVFLIYGTKGVLKLCCSDHFGGDIQLIQSVEADATVTTVENDFPYAENSRGVGPSEMASAILEGRKNRANKEQAYHVLDVIECIMESSKKRCFVDVASTCEKPAPFSF